MMRIEVIHENGKRLVFRASQVACFDDTGQPVAITYEHGDLIVHTDASQDDFNQTCQLLRVKPIP